MKNGMSMPQISQRAFNSPLLIHPGKAAGILHGLGGRITGGELNLHLPQAFDPADIMSEDSSEPYASLLGGEMADQIRDGYRHGYTVKDGVAVIAISGVLIHRGSWIGESSGQTSYEGIRAQIDAAVDDPAVLGIALEIDSGGGEVAGCFDLADRIRAVTKIKPVWAFVADHAYSAAYALASQASRIIIPRTGGVGSIGVLCIHIDISVAMKKAGFKATMIHAGANKVDGNPYQSLPDDVRASMESEMESLRAVFTQTVASGRGEVLTAKEAAATEARCFTGSDAISEGLADEVDNLRSAFKKFVAEINRGVKSTSTRTAAKVAKKIGKLNMAKITGQRAAARAKARMEDDPVDDEEDDVTTAEDQPVDDEEDDDEPTAEDEEDDDEEEEDDDAPALTPEGRRIAAIVKSPAAKGRRTLANHLAFNTKQSAKSAIATLKASPKATSKPASTLSARMAAKHPALGSGGGQRAAAASADLATKRMAAKIKSRR